MISTGLPADRELREPRIMGGVKHERRLRHLGIGKRNLVVCCPHCSVPICFGGRALFGAAVAGAVHYAAEGPGSSPGVLSRPGFMTMRRRRPDAASENSLPGTDSGAV